MANVLISNLPSWTGSAADLRWFVMNNSGETETFKYSGYTSPLKYTNDTDRNIVSINYANSAVDGITSMIIGGDDRNYITTPNTLGLSGHTILNSSNSYIDFNSTTWPGWSGIYSAQNAYINGAAWGATIMGGIDNYITHSPFAIVLGGQSNRVYGSTADSFHAARGAIVGGFNNYITETSPRENSAIIGCVGSYINETTNGILAGTTSSYLNNSTYCGIFQSRTSSIQNSGDCAVIGGHSNNINNGYESGIFAGYSNTMTNPQDSAMLGGRGNLIDMGNACCGGNVIMGGVDNYINNSPGVLSSILGGTTNVIRDTSTNSHIIGGRNSIVSGKTDVVMLGTSGRTADANSTTYVENLRIYRQSISGNYNNGSQSTGYNINWDNGNMQKITLTGSLSFSATNISDGATYILKLVQDGSGNRTATWNSSQFKWPNGTAPTLSTGANAVDIITFAAMDGVLYGVAQKNFS